MSSGSRGDADVTLRSLKVGKGLFCWGRAVLGTEPVLAGPRGVRVGDIGVATGLQAGTACLTDEGEEGIGAGCAGNASDRIVRLTELSGVRLV